MVNIISFFAYRDKVADLMAEVSCASAEEANIMLDRYPEYRHAKDDSNHPFWKTSASKMLNDLSLIAA